MGPNGSENFKTLLLLQITAKSFQISPDFSSQWSPQKYDGIFEILKIEVLIFFFLFSLTWDSMGAKTPKHYSSLKSVLKPFKFFLIF